MMKLIKTYALECDGSCIEKPRSPGFCACNEIHNHATAGTTRKLTYDMFGDEAANAWLEMRDYLTWTTHLLEIGYIFFDHKSRKYIDREGWIYRPWNMAIKSPGIAS